MTSPRIRARCLATASCWKPRAATSCSRRRKGEIYPEPQSYTVRPPPAACRYSRRPVPAGILHRRLHGRSETLQHRAAGIRRVRQEGLSAAARDSQHGEAAGAADRGGRRRNDTRIGRTRDVVAQRLLERPQRAEAAQLHRRSPSWPQRPAPAARIGRHSSARRRHFSRAGAWQPDYVRYGGALIWVTLGGPTVDRRTAGGAGGCEARWNAADRQSGVLNARQRACARRLIGASAQSPTASLDFSLSASALKFTYPANPAIAVRK